ncbi:MAG: hypothetical protein V4819_06950 [Verrucomicrobiota bacterium]
MIPDPKRSFSVLPNVRMAAGCGLLSLSLLLGKAAKAEVASPAEVIAELTAAYAKQGGYIATYHSVGEGKSLACTLGSDFASGLGATHLTAIKGDQKMEGRIWSTSNDRMFIDSGGNLLVFKGMNEESKSIDDLLEVLTLRPAEAEKQGFFYTPGMLLEKASIGPSLAPRSKLGPPWDDEVEEAPIQASDAKTVTFLTKKHGLLTINRENGMLVRQSLEGESGEARVLELTDLQPNPGKEAVAKISADWSTAGAVEKPVVAWMAPLRLMAFQLVIDAAERGEVDKDKLDKLLEDQYEVLQHFAKACINETEGSFASKGDWPKLFGEIKASARDQWQPKNPGSGAINDAVFLEYLQKPETRLTLRNSMVEGILEAGDAPETAMDDIFGKGGWASLKVGNDRGVAAKQSLVKALSRAYFEALIDLKMEKQWDQRDGLD